MTSRSRVVWYPLVLILITGCGVRADLDMPRKFQAAEQAFGDATESDDYLKAASLYQEILDNGVTSGAVLYNLGNAFMKAGQRGRAIVAYRQALRYRPRDPYLKANLRYALGTANDQMTRKSLPETIMFWQSWFSYAEMFYVTTAAVILTLVCGLIARISHKGLLLNRFTLAAMLLTIVAVCSNAYDWYQIEWTRHGVVVADKTVARKGNSTNYEPAFTEPLYEGTEFVVLEQRHDWLLIRLGPSAEGWVPQRSVVTY